jgi:1L-myo-inositol 1-phosphate cytidylyltransferase
MTTEQHSKTGVILAAGFGSRLEGTSDDTSLKPLTPVAGKPLIYRTIHSLEIAGCEKVVIVVGHGGEEVEAEVRESYTGDTELIFAKNERYELQNGVSVLTAAPYVSDPFILTMADHILSDDLMELAGSHIPPQQGATLLVDYKIDTIFDMDDATKVLADENKIDQIGKQIAEYNCIDTGVFIATQGLIDALNDELERRGDASLSDGIQHLASEDKMTVLDIGEAFWQDVDTPEMLAHAEEQLEMLEAEV